MSWCGSPVILLISKNLFAILLRTRDTESGGARNAHIFHICSASCAPSFPVSPALVTDRKQVLRSGEQRKSKRGARLVIRLRNPSRERTNAAHIGRALSDRNRAARIEKVECMRRFQRHFIRRQRERRIHQALCLRFICIELTE